MVKNECRVAKCDLRWSFLHMRVSSVHITVVGSILTVVISHHIAIIAICIFGMTEMCNLRHLRPTWGLEMVKNECRVARFDRFGMSDGRFGSPGGPGGHFGHPGDPSRLPEP
jgi:hypothetical protein